MDLYEYRPRHALPDPLNTPGLRPVWEPPILDYSDLIGDEYDKKYKALLKYVKGDVVAATRNMDHYMERIALDKYQDWVSKEQIKDNALCEEHGSDSHHQIARVNFWIRLGEAIREERVEDILDREKRYLTFQRNEDGTYTAFIRKDHVSGQRRDRQERNQQSAPNNLEAITTSPLQQAPAIRLPIYPTIETPPPISPRHSIVEDEAERQPLLLPTAPSHRQRSCLSCLPCFGR